MTADKHQFRSHRINGNLSRGQAKSAAGGPGLERSSQGLRFGDGTPAAHHSQLCHGFPPGKVKLAGFGTRMAPDIQSPATPIPIWFAALIASQCQARAKGNGRDVRWNCISGRAVYTNRGAEEETIEPLGVCLQRGDTVAVSWNPGETSYKVEIFQQFD